MKIRVICIVFFVQMLFPGFVNAQTFMRPGSVPTTQEPSLPTNGDNLDWSLPPLQTLINHAIEHSPLVKSAENEIQMGEYELKDVYRDWMRRVGFMADTRYGSMFDYSRLVDSPGMANTNSVMLSYGFGASASMPLSDMIDRKRTKQKARLRVEQAKISREEVINGVQQMVINSYYDVLSAQKTLALSNELNLTAGLVFEKAKMDYTQNRISLADYAKENEAYMSAQNALELQKYTFTRFVRILEIIVGIELLK